MSNNMEQDKSEILTAKEKEEEEMKRELLDMKMYESWYTYKEMKQILGFINESKDMANVKMNDEKNAQKELLHTSNECTSELMLKSNLVQQLELQEDNDIPKLINPHKYNHTLPILDQLSSHSHGSSEHASSNADSRNYFYKNKTLENDDIFDRLHDNLNLRDSYSHSLNRCVSLKEKNILQDPHSTNDTEIKINSHFNSNQKLEQWQINPLDSCVSENDVPLREPERPIVQDRMPFKLCKDAETSESLEKLLIALNIHLKQTAELWHSWHRTADSKFQWGSPIQVGVTKSSLDRKSMTNNKSEENQMECTEKCNSQRPNKRKATLAVSSSNTTNSSSDEDEKVIKRKKIHVYEPSNRILRSHNEAHVTADEQNQCLGNENINKYVITETKNLKMKHKEHQCSSDNLLSSYSRKFAPPNLRKCINKKKKDNFNILANTSSVLDSIDSTATNLNFKQKDNILTDEEIFLELEKDNTINDVKTSSENIEVKPLPTKGLSHRIKNECMILERIQMEKQKKLQIEKEKAQKKENEEIRKREEFYKKQVEDKKQKEKQKEEKEKSKEEKSKKWRSVINTKSQKKNSEECKERMRGLHEQNDNETLFQDILITKKMDVMKDNVSNYVNCPICNQCFPSDKIEAHAAGCEQYMTDNEDENNANLMQTRIVSLNANNEEILECGVCLKYRTTNDANYEQHINNCLHKQHKEESIPEYTSTEIDNILNSPVRCYKPISEQTDSEIDYRKQFPSNSRTQIHSNKKGKH